MSWLERYNRNKKTLIDANLYDPSQEHDACGVGFIASIDGIPNRRVVISGIEALKAVWHRGAVDADGKTGDGAGIQVEIPKLFFEEEVKKTGHEIMEGDLGIGMIFLPRNDYSALEKCRTMKEIVIFYQCRNILKKQLFVVFPMHLFAVQNGRAEPFLFIVYYTWGI